MQRLAPGLRSRLSTEEQLVRENLPLVHYAVSEVASRVPRHVTRDDLVSAAMLGLAQATKTYDDSRGVTFQRYARTRIKGALLDELRDRDWASRSVRSRARSVQAASDQLTTRLARTPTAEEVGARMGLPAAEVHKVLDDVRRATVLNYESVFADAEGEVALPSSSPAPEEELSGRERVAYLRDAVVMLPERLRAVVVGYFFEERPMHEIAVELGVTESRVSQMRGEALALLKEGMDAQLDPEAVPGAEGGNGRVARRKAAYYAAVASASDFRTRLDADPQPLATRIAAM